MTTMNIRYIHRRIILHLRTPDHSTEWTLHVLPNLTEAVQIWLIIGHNNNELLIINEKCDLSGLTFNHDDNEFYRFFLLSCFLRQWTCLQSSGSQIGLFWQSSF